GIGDDGHTRGDHGAELEMRPASLVDALAAASRALHVPGADADPDEQAPALCPRPLHHDIGARRGRAHRERRDDGRYYELESILVEHILNLPEAGASPLRGESMLMGKARVVPGALRWRGCSFAPSCARTGRYVAGLGHARALACSDA